MYKKKHERKDSQIYREKNWIFSESRGVNSQEKKSQIYKKNDTF